MRKEPFAGLTVEIYNSNCTGNCGIITSCLTNITGECIAGVLPGRYSAVALYNGNFGGALTKTVVVTQRRELGKVEFDLINMSKCHPSKGGGSNSITGAVAETPYIPTEDNKTKENEGNTQNTSQEVGDHDKGHGNDEGCDPDNPGKSCDKGQGKGNNGNNTQAEQTETQGNNGQKGQQGQGNDKQNQAQQGDQGNNVCDPAIEDCEQNKGKENKS